MPAEDLPVAEFAFPGPLRDRLVAADDTLVVAQAFRLVVPGPTVPVLNIIGPVGIGKPAVADATRNPRPG